MLFNKADFDDYVSNAKSKPVDTGYKLMREYFTKHLFPFPTVYINKNIPLIRVRFHHNNEKFFDEESQLGYIRNASAIKTYGRCNCPGESIFYCSDSQIISYVEVCQMKTGKTPSSHYYTVSIWRMKEDINIGFLLNKEQINEHVTILFNEWNSFFDKLSLDYKEAVREFQQALCEQFMIASDKTEIHYIVSAAYTHFLFHQWNDQGLSIDGFAYPSCIDSSEIKSKGLNFCFVSDIVGFGKKIELVDACRFYMELNGTTFTDKECIQVKYIDKRNGRLFW